MIDFPASPTVGQTFTSGGIAWVWDGTKWAAGGVAAGYLPLTGGTLTGPLLLAADPTAALGASTKQYVDSVRYGDNRIINGDMRIDQRNNGASGTAQNAYTVDRWFFQASQAGKGNWQRQSGPANFGFPYSLVFASNSAYTLLAADYFAFQQPVESDVVSDFAWGTVSAQSATLSFWAQSSLTGTFSGAIRNGTTPARSYPFTFSLPTANTWTKIVVTIPGDTTGTWPLSGNGAGLYVRFDLGSGTTYRSAANVWASGDYMGATGAVSVVATNGANLFLTGVKLEIGSIATPYNRQSLAKSMADCQRYYQKIGGAINNDLLIQAYASASALAFSSVIGLPVSMRSAPTVTPVGITLTSCTASYFGGLQSVSVQLNSTGVANIAWTNNTTAAYLTANAEL